jgi:tetratricopeptide (TPR) repeat protein
MAFDPEDPTYRQLRKRVLQNDGRVVPFVGAGLSVYGEKGQRLPLWGELLERLVAEGVELGLVDEVERQAIESALQERHYIEATDHILGELGEPTFRRIVERELDDTGKEMPPAVTKLVAVDWPVIATTNLDRMIARAYLERHRQPIHRVTSQDLRKLADAMSGAQSSERTVLAQIHGDIETYPSWVLTKKHYDQLLQKPGYLQALKNLFLSQVFFVGFGLRDDDFDLVLQTIAEIFPDGGGEIYALIGASQKGKEVVRNLLKHNGLRPIYYDDSNPPVPDDPFGKHRPVYECLAHLAASWAVARGGLDVTLKYFPELDPHMVQREADIERLAQLIERGGVVQVLGLGGSGKTSMVQQFLAGRRLEIANAGYQAIFGCSLYRADIAQFIYDLALATVGATAESIPGKVESICRHLRTHRTVLVLDGVEVVLDANGVMRNPYLLRILEGVREGDGLVVLTSRIAASGGACDQCAQIEISPLTAAEIRDFLDLWGLGGLDESAKRRLEQVTAGHPLALRILAGLLMDVPEPDAVTTIERSSVIDTSDEVDPLRENRLARVLGSYLQHLESSEKTFLICASAFEGPAPFPLVEAALARSYPDTAINKGLVGQDLRPIIEKLIRRRLLTVGGGGELSSHPTVREYFDRRAAEATESLAPLHRFLGAEQLRESALSPEKFEEAAPLILAARHAAAAEDWTLFDELVRRRLMRGPRQHLCNRLGAWEEGLALARIGQASSVPSELTPEPAYYPATVARCLKHLGRSTESRRVYRQALEAAGQSRDPHTAKYVNNFLTLLISRGELLRADMLVELNMRALSWIDEQWQYCWQLEHGLASFAYLRMLQGDPDEALRLMDLSEETWNVYPGGPMRLFSHYPYHRAEIVLLMDSGGHDAALHGVWELLSVAREESWPESVCRGHIQAARVFLDRCAHNRSLADLAEADQHLREAREITAGMIVPEVEIRHLLTQISMYLVRCSLDEAGDSEHVELNGLVSRLALRVEMSELHLFDPEVSAAWGVLAHLRDSTGEARRRYMQAVEQCREQGNVHAATSPRSPVHWLGARFEQESVDPPIATTDPVAFIDAGVTEDLMFDQLAAALSWKQGDRL